jgi:hypothetical protein
MVPIYSISVNQINALLVGIILIYRSPKIIQK